jgi:hypothetical protein
MVCWEEDTGFLFHPNLLATPRLRIFALFFVPTENKLLDRCVLKAGEGWSRNLGWLRFEPTWSRYFSYCEKLKLLFFLLDNDAFAAAPGLS